MEEKANEGGFMCSDERSEQQRRKRARSERRKGGMRTWKYDGLRRLASIVALASLVANEELSLASLPAASLLAANPPTLYHNNNNNNNNHKQVIAIVCNLLAPMLVIFGVQRVRSGEEQSDKLRERIKVKAVFIADTSIRNIVILNSAVVFNTINTTPFAIRFARRSTAPQQQIQTVQQPQPRGTTPPPASSPARASPSSGRL